VTANSSGVRRALRRVIVRSKGTTDGHCLSQLVFLTWYCQGGKRIATSFAGWGNTNFPLAGKAQSHPTAEEKVRPEVENRRFGIRNLAGGSEGEGNQEVRCGELRTRIDRRTQRSLPMQDCSATESWPHPCCESACSAPDSSAHAGNQPFLQLTKDVVNTLP
jgi:hypothetical protein